MAPADAEIIRLWLESNLAEATKQGGDALEELRETVKAMGPEVAAAFDKMAGATVEVAQEQAKLKQQTMEFTEPFALQVETTKAVVQEQAKLKQQTMEFTEVLELHGGAERDLSTLSQEVLKRMQERQDAQMGVNRAIEMATEDMRAQAEAQEALDAVVAKNQVTIAGAGTNFTKLSRGILGAERAAQALASGTGLARVGPMMESVTLAVGGPAGLGLALGAAAFALEGMLPKIIAWAEHWEKGAKTVDQVTLALNNLDKAQEISDRERAVKKADRQITKLEDKEDAQGFLSEDDREKLERLQADVFNTKRKIAEEKIVAGVGQSKQQREAGAAVKEALAETGGGDAAAKMLADREGISIDEAYSAVSGAIQSGAHVESLKRNIPGFAERYAQIGPEGKAAKEAEKQRKKEEKDAEKEDKEQAAETKHLASERYAEEQRIEREQKQAEAKAQRERDAASKHAKAEKAHEASQRYASEQKQEHDEAREQTKAQREQAKFAKEHTPEALYHQQRAAEQNAVMGYAQNLNQQNVAQGGMPATPEFMHHVANAAAQQVTMGADIATAVHIAIAQVQAKVAEDFRKGMMRQHQASTSFYAP